MADVTRRRRAGAGAIVLGVITWLAGPGVVTTASASPPAWTPATVIPGTAALNVGGDSTTWGINCATSTTCFVGGSYEDAHQHTQGYLSTLTNSTWRTISFPSLAALNTGGDAFVAGVSCSSQGNCTAFGAYTLHGNGQAFVMNEVGGKWHNAQPFPGFFDLEGEHHLTSSAISVECVAGAQLDCTGVGSLSAVRVVDQEYEYINVPVVASEVNGMWKPPQLLTWSDDLHNNFAYVTGVNCPTAGNCTLVGYINPYDPEPFIVSEVNYRWHTAQTPRGMVANGNQLPYEIQSLSCPDADNCVMVGTYNWDRTFIDTETAGRWGTPSTIPRANDLDVGTYLQSVGVECASVGNCVVIGDYDSAQIDPDTNSPIQLVFVADEVGGLWGAAEELPGLSALTSSLAQFQDVTCEANDDCVAVGLYSDSSNKYQDFVDTSVQGTWGVATEVPGVSTLGAAARGEVSVSCTTSKCVLVDSIDADYTKPAQSFFSELTL